MNLFQSREDGAKSIDRYTLLLGFVVVVLFVLFGYLIQTDREVEHDTQYHLKLDALLHLDDQINRILLRHFRFINYDDVLNLNRKFETLLSKIRSDDLCADGLFIDAIVEQYQQKKALVEDFKAANARATNSLFVLFDLRKTIGHELFDASISNGNTILNREAKQQLDQVFFSLSLLVMDFPYNKRDVLLQIEKMQKIEKAFPPFTHFQRHAALLIQDAETIQNIKKAMRKIPLNASIGALSLRLQQQHNTRRTQQRLVVSLMFVFALFLLVLLFKSHGRIRRDTKRLRAFRSALENSDNAIVLTNEQREIQYVNDAFEHLTGYTRDEVLGQTPSILKSGLLSSVFYQEMNATLKLGKKWQGEFINRRKDGTLFYEKASIVPIFEEGKLVQYLAIKLDISEYKKQQLSLQRAATVYEMIGEGILVTDASMRILSANPAYLKMVGYTHEEELIGEEPAIIDVLQEKDIYAYQQLKVELATKGRWSGRMHNPTKQGDALPVWLSVAAVYDGTNEIQNYIAIYTNLEELISSQEKAEYLAYHDSLTGLPNRAYFDRNIADVLARAQKYDQQIGVFFMDLDRFKVINDTLGHLIGDGMLTELATRIRAILDDTVLFARLGGDEFVLVAPLKEGREEAGRIADVVLFAVRESIHVQDYYLNVSASMGIALFPDDAREKHAILKYADSAMYAAKEKGKDNYQFYTRQLSFDMQGRLNLEQELLHAEERGELHVYYQPQYDLKSRKVVGAEALLRWKSEDLGEVPPDEFIAIAEETGMVVQIGYYVFEEACKAYVQWRKQGHDIKTIAINVSSVQFREEGFLENIRAIILRTDIAPECVEIEITERVIMEYSTSNMTTLDELRALGCQISIDDFGTGYSSMSYLKKLPIDTIKIDRSFVDELPDDPYDSEVSRAIIALSKSLRYRVVAEGIENEAQEIFLRENHCDVGQGYYFARPMDAETFLDFLDKQDGNRKI